MSKTEAKGCFVGIDVSKDKLDVFVRPSGQGWTQPREEVGELCRRLKEIEPTLIVVEPTGGYEVSVVDGLIRGGLKVSREHALRIHHHAKGSGQLAKTDRLDASMIAHYAQCYGEQIEPMRVCLEDQGGLQQLTSRRRQLVEMRAAQKNRLGVPNLSEKLRRSCERMIEALSQEIEEIEGEIEQTIRSSEHHSYRRTVVETIPGVGSTVSSVLLASLPELGTVSRKQIAALAGVAPFQYQSGRFKGQAKIRGGRWEVRSALYMAVLSAKRHNPQIRAFYQKLIERGKRKKVALVACMHKLLRMLNAMLSKGNLYQPSMS